MKRISKAAVCTLAVTLAMIPSMFAQEGSDDQDGSDLNVAVDAAREIFEHEVGLPTSTTSAVQIGVEELTAVPTSTGSVLDLAVGTAARQAGLSEGAIEALTGAIGAFIAASSPSSTAGPNEDEPRTWERRARQAQEAARADQFYQQNIKAQFEQDYSQSLRKLKPPPTAPQISDCGVGACK